jgi:hypothetical protein
MIAAARQKKKMWIRLADPTAEPDRRPRLLSFIVR